jgi:hypothetical protein
VTTGKEDGGGANLRAFAIVIAGFDAFIVAIVLATMLLPLAFYSVSVTVDIAGVLVVIVAFGLTALPATMLALRWRWLKTATLLALAFPIVLVALSIAVLSTID